MNRSAGRYENAMNGQQGHSEHPKVEPRWLVPAVDMVLILIAWMLGYVMRYDWQLIRPVFDPTRAEFAPYLPYAFVSAVLLYLNFQANGLYRNIRGRTWLEEVTIIINGTAAATIVILALFFVLQPLVTSRLMLIYVMLLMVVLLSLARVLRRIVMAYLRGKGIGVERVLIIGMGETGQAVLRAMLARSELGYRVVGYLDDNPNRGGVDLGRVPGLGSIDNLAAAIQTKKADLVVITLRWKHYDRILSLARISRQHKANVRIVPDIFQLNMRQVQVENLDGIPLLGVNGHQPFQGTPRLFKRALDMLLILLASPIWLPVFAIVAIAIKLDDGGKILYSQTRVGEGGKLFQMIKFRTMIPNADAFRQQLITQTGQDPKRPKLVDDPRITRVGHFLRRTSLDELPNLFNVIKGEMSLVGPRPPMPDEVALYEPWHLQRLQIIPGITGLWQVSGRSEIPFDEMCLLDIYYIENWSIKFDLQILLMTLPRVLMRSGAY